MDLLEEEQASNVYASVFNNSTNQPLPNMTLEQINKSIIKHVLEDNKGNQSKTARQLGISRTTLWRYIGREK